MLVGLEHVGELGEEEGYEWWGVCIYRTAFF